MHTEISRVDHRVADCVTLYVVRMSVTTHSERTGFSWEIFQVWNEKKNQLEPRNVVRTHGTSFMGGVLFF